MISHLRYEIRCDTCFEDSSGIAAVCPCCGTYKKLVSNCDSSPKASAKEQMVYASGVSVVEDFLVVYEGLLNEYNKEVSGEPFIRPLIPLALIIYPRSRRDLALSEAAFRFQRIGNQYEAGKYEHIKCLGENAVTQSELETARRKKIIRIRVEPVTASVKPTSTTPVPVILTPGA